MMKSDNVTCIVCEDQKLTTCYVLTVNVELLMIPIMMVE